VLPMQCGSVGSEPPDMKLWPGSPPDKCKIRE